MHDRYEEGMTTRRRVLGDQHVNRADDSKSAFDKPFQDLLVEAAWSHVWSRQTISPRERSMLTIALLAGLGNHHELALHLRATVNTLASKADVMEALLHVAIYAGIPRANHAFSIAKEVFTALEEDDQKPATPGKEGGNLNGGAAASPHEPAE